MSLSNRYTSQEIENKWYAHWMQKNYFHATPDEREPFSIIIPPPNVTGILHMGHMLNNTIQDIFIRKARLEGKNACWVPGTDHASIATEAKVVRMLREQGIKKSDLTREEFLKYAWEWKDKYGGIILEQLKKLGASCDWERTAFTMDEVRSEAVIKAFVDLYKKGKLYRGKRMINWDPEAKTVLSNEEVLYNEENAQLHYLRYFVAGSNNTEYIVIATQRPETIMADAAVAVHPNDERYRHLQGKKVLIPIINKEIPIIFDDYVDIEFGTGALKITPAHDQNDYEIGIRHQLEIVDILNDDGTLNEDAQILVGLDRFEARKRIRKLLEENQHLDKIEDYLTNIGRSERTNSIVEPKLSLQWYIDMKKFSPEALDSVMNDVIQFFPKSQKNIYNHWMSNLRDWCISRQLWWGHRIPAWYYDGETFVAETAEEALVLAQAHFKNNALTIHDLKQDEDVLDTWFSSWLWPISVFDGFNPNSEDFKYFYPTSILVTGWDIIFLWVARMILAGYEWKGEKPYSVVYFTGMVRDKQRRKMSKSLGNSPDLLKLIEDYGADGVRFGVLSCSPAGGDLLFDEKLCEQGRNFCNKLWNALRLLKSWNVEEKTPDEVNILAVNWLENRFQEVLHEINRDFSQYRLSDAIISLYNFIWDEFCSWYLEMIKPKFGDPIDSVTYNKTISILENILIVLHPFMPFITEEIWHQIKDRAEGEDCVVSKYPTASDFDKKRLTLVNAAKDVITKVRDARNKQSIKLAEQLPLIVESSATSTELFALNGLSAMIMKMANLSSFQQTTNYQGKGITFVCDTDKFHIDYEIKVDVESERKRLSEEIQYTKGFIQSILKKLENEKFVSNAPPAVIDSERKKLSDGQARLSLLEKSLANLD
ncbi:MAG: valine--tRNA ligase [Saprospiraceae bacterium]|nr:valine--tRNA ligase [Saprospiraceae bacterium]